MRIELFDVEGQIFFPFSDDPSGQLTKMGMYLIDSQMKRQMLIDVSPFVKPGQPSGPALFHALVEAVQKFDSLSGPLIEEDAN
jgi:hypothetical protein